MKVAEQPIRSKGRPQGLAPFWYILISLTLIPTPNGGIVSLMIVGAVVTLPVWLPRVWEVRDYRWLTCLAGTWLLAQTASNLLHGSSSVGALLGSWRPGVAVIAAGLFFYCLQRAKDPFGVIFVALVAHVGYYMLGNFETVDRDPWKYVYGIPFCLILIAAVDKWRFGRRKLVITVLVGLSLLNILLGFRSLGACAIVAAVLVAAGTRRNMGKRRVAVRAGLAFSLAFGLLATLVRYDLLPTRPGLPSTTNPFEYLMQSRPEFIVSTTLFQRHPIFGLGSDRTLQGGDVSAILERVADLQFGLSLPEQQRLFGQGANTHSLFPDAVVSAGVIAAPFWIFVLFLVISAAVGAKKSSGFMALGAALLVWDSFFSPWSAHYEIILGLVVGMALYLRMPMAQLGSVQGMGVDRNAA